MKLLKNWSLSAALSVITAGFVTVLVGFTSSVAIVFQAATALGATPAQIGSWMLALGLGMGLTCIGLSLRYRIPVVTAWSTPGAAMLITGATGVPMSDAIGAFVLCAGLIAVAGFSGWFERVLDRIPLPLAAGMLAGVLLRFGLDAFASLKTQFVLVLAMFIAYLLLRRWWPRYAVIVALLVGIAIAAAQGLLQLGAVQFSLAVPVLVWPTLSVNAVIGLALPLFVVTMASQNVPGVAAMRAAGYTPPTSAAVGWTGLLNVLLAPLGAFSLGLAAITAAICMGREAHEDPARRYVAAVAAGVFYVIVGVLGATVAALFAAFPRELVLAIAGLALIGTIGSGLAQAVRDEQQREPALITFLVTASGLSLWGIGAAFWGLVAGVLALVVLKK